MHFDQMHGFIGERGQLIGADASIGITTDSVLRENSRTLRRVHDIL